MRMASSPGPNTFRERRPTAGRRLAADHCLRKHRAIVDLDKTPLSGQTAPREQLARRQSIPPRRRRYLPPPIVALAHDPALLFQRPTTPGTSLDHLKSRHLRHSRMISHTPMSSPPHPSHKAVLSAGIPSFRLMDWIKASSLMTLSGAPPSFESNFRSQSE